MLKQALVNNETLGFYHVPEPEVRFGIIKHFLNSTSSNIRLVLPGQKMLGSALLRPTSLVLTKQI